jgi:hypothetical protein
MKNNINPIFQIPDDGMENAKKKVLRKLEIIRELHDYPILKKIKESNAKCFSLPNNYLVTANQEINQKIKAKDLKAKDITQHETPSKNALLIHLFVKRIAAVLILTLTAWFAYKFLLNKKENTPKGISGKSYADTCKTLACIERETILNELYYEASEDELENLN